MSVIDETPDANVTPDMVHVVSCGDSDDIHVYGQADSASALALYKTLGQCHLRKNMTADSWGRWQKVMTKYGLRIVDHREPS